VPIAAVPPALVPTGQATNPIAILDAVTNRAGFFTGLIDRTVEWDSSLADRPQVQYDNFLTVSFTTIRPQASDGAGRWGWRVRGGIVVGVWTKASLDATGTHKAWNRKHWPVVGMVYEALAGIPLYSKYDTGVGTRGDPAADADQITAPLDLVDAAELTKVTAKSDYGYTAVPFSALFTLALDPRLVNAYVPQTP
jgi:hypothetical protein